MKISKEGVDRGLCFQLITSRKQPLVNTWYNLFQARIITINRCELEVSACTSLHNKLYNSADTYH